MKKKLRVLLLTGAAYALTLMALISAAGACTGWHYQPKLPESLKK